MNSFDEINEIPIIAMEYPGETFEGESPHENWSDE